MLVTDPSEIAAAVPIAASATAGNQGNATISAGQVLNPTNPQLRTAATITFSSATQYTISGDPTVLHLYAGFGYRCQRLASGDQRHAGGRRLVHGSRQQQRHRRQPQRVAAGGLDGRAGVEQRHDFDELAPSASSSATLASKPIRRK